MATDKNFIVKNGLEVGGQEVVSSSGVVTSAALGGQTLSTTDSPTFADLTLTGNLNLTGDINSYNVTDLDVTDQTITLGAGQLEALSGGSGIIIDGSGASILWDETNTEFDINNPIHVAGGITFGTSDSTLADNNVRFKSTGAAYIDHNTVGQDINFRVSNASSLDTTALTIDSSGNVGIGITSLDEGKLHVKSDGAGEVELLTLENSTGTNGKTTLTFKTTSTDATKSAQIFAERVNASGHTDLAFRTYNGSTTEAMRIDSSGNLLVGTTDDVVWNNSANSSADNGHNLRDDGRAGFSYYAATANSNATVNINRTSTDGDLIRLFKSGSLVGSIGVSSSGNRVYFAGSGDSLCIDASLNAIFSGNTSGSGTNNTLDIGTSSTRFKDLYLSGTASVEDDTSSPSILVKASQQTSSTTPTASIFLSSGSLSSNASAPAIISYRDADYSSAALRSSGLKFQITKSNVGSEVMRLTSERNLLLGRSTDFASLGYRLQVDHDTGTTLILVASGNTSTKTALTMRDKNVGTPAGSITYDGTAAQYNTSSDYRLKENIQPLANGLARVQQLNPVQFDWIETGGTSEGFIAHEAQEVFAEAVSGEKDGTEMQGMDYGRITPLLVKAIQEQQTIIESLQSRLDEAGL